MPARLIINADDFGLTAGINRSIEELHRAGVLSSATLMANGPAFEDAIAVARRNPSLGVGCHIVLADGVPLSPTAMIPSLLGPDSTRFRTSLLAFAAAALRGTLRPADISTEAKAQIRRVQNAGIVPTHLDTHKHTHLFRAVSGPLIEVARNMNIRALRNPFEQPWSLDLGHGSSIRRLQIRALRRLGRQFYANLRIREQSILTTSGSLGISSTGQLNQAHLRQLLQNLPGDGTWELVCHPGYSDPDLDLVATRLRSQRETEHAALLAVIPHALSQPGGPSLIHFGELAPGFD